MALKEKYLQEKQALSFKSLQKRGKIFRQAVPTKRLLAGIIYMTSHKKLLDSENTRVSGCLSRKN